MHTSCGGRESTLHFGGGSLTLTKADNEITASVCVSTRWDKLIKEPTKRLCSLPPFAKELIHHLPLATSAPGN